MSRKTIKYLAAIAVILILTLAVSAAGDKLVNSGQCGDNAYWRLYDGGELQITGSGKMDNYNKGGAPWYEYSETISNVAIAYGITHIGNYAFYFCENLTSITIPDSVTGISSFAFDGCTGLTSIVIPKSVKLIERFTFYDCKGLAAIYVDSGNTYFHSNGNCLIETENNTLIAGCKTSIIPSYVTSIECGAFEGCTGLTSITIPDSVNSIESGAFEGCTGLTSITIPESVKWMGYGVFSGCEGLTAIYVDSGNTYFHSKGNCLIETENNTLIAGCKTSIIPSYVTSIEYGAFQGCTGLTSITIPNSVKRISNYAFENCISLSSIMIPDSVNSIGISSFDGCTNLQNVYFEGDAPSIYAATPTFNASFPKAVTLYYIGGKDGWDNIIDNTWNGYTIKELEKCGDNAGWILQENGELLILGSGDMDNFGYTTMPWYSITRQIKKVVIQNGITSIGQYAFQDCTNLSCITIGREVSNIGSLILSGCTELTVIEVNEENTYYHATGNCLIETETNKLIAGCKNSKIPSDVKRIGRYAFNYCTGLTGITIPNSVEYIEYYAFHGCKGLTSITIPKSVTGIGTGVFNECVGLEEIKVDVGNEVYKSENNCIIEKSNNTLIAGCKNSIIPSYVTSIGAEAFMHCKGLTSITIPESVKSIDSFTFYGCTNLQNVYFEGNAPSVYAATVTYHASFPKTVTLHYIYGKTGWDNNGTWNGYTIKNNIGDVNNDGTHDAADGLLLAHYIAGYNVNSFTRVCADVDLDGEITPRDSMILARHLAQWTGYGTLPYKDVQ